MKALILIVFRKFIAIGIFDNDNLSKFKRVLLIQKTMNFRKISIVLALLVLVFAIIASQFLGKKTKAKETVAKNKTTNTKENKIREVSVRIANNTTITAPIAMTGKLIAPDKVEIFAEVQGKLLTGHTRFKEGNFFRQGALLIHIDDEEAHFNLLSQKSTLLNAITQMMPDMKLDYPEAYVRWQKYLNEFDVSKPLQKLPEPVTEKDKYYVITRTIFNQYYTIKGLETRLQKYLIYAPFSGVVSESNINPGTLVRPGQKLGEFINSRTFELEASVSLKDIDFLKLNDKVALYSEDIKGKWLGSIQRISDKMDAKTQTVKVFIEVNGKQLREGMFLKGTVEANQIKNAISVPRKLLIEGSEIFTVHQGKLLQTPVKIVRYAGNNAIVQGIENNTKLLNEASAEFYQGMKVKIRQ